MSTIAVVEHHSLATVTAPSSSWRNGQSKDAQIIAGCKRLQARQRHNEAFSSLQIANECAVDQRCVEMIVRKALHKVGVALMMRHPGILDELSNSLTREELRSRVASLRLDRTGKPARREKATTCRRLHQAGSNRVSPEVPSITACTELVRQSRPAYRPFAFSENAD